MSVDKKECPKCGTEYTLTCPKCGYFKCGVDMLCNCCPERKICNEF